jgi:carboxynorspermidine synthase
MSILLIGAGSVGWAVAQKCALHNDIFGDITIASRTKAKGDRLVADIRARGNVKDSGKNLRSVELDVANQSATAGVIEDSRAELVINLGPPPTNVPVMEACLRKRVGYIDTSVAVDLCSEGQQVPQAYDPQWRFREPFAEAGVTALLSVGFDPGVVSIFVRHAQLTLFDTLDTIDILDVNAGNHGRKFATNFDPVTNLSEIQGDSFYFEGGTWKSVSCHSRSMDFDFPEVGSFTLYSMAHDEICSLAAYIPARKIEFWMGFSENYLKYFNVLRDVGMLSNRPVTTASGARVSPLEVLKAVLPEPGSLAPDYTGKTCIAALVSGAKAGKKRKILIYNICDHRQCYLEVGSQAISYTAGIPAVVAGLLYFQGIWRQPGVWNVEQLDPVPFLDLMPKMGLSWHVADLQAN